MSYLIDEIRQVSKLSALHLNDINSNFPSPNFCFKFAIITFSFSPVLEILNADEINLKCQKIKIIRRHDDSHHNDTQHNDTQHNDIQHNKTQHNETQYNESQHHYSQHSNKKFDTQHNET